MEVRLACVSRLERLIGKSGVQAKADFSVPDRGLTTTGKMELFSRGEKQEEIKNGFQLRKLDKNPSCCPRTYPYDIFSIAVF